MDIDRRRKRLMKRFALGSVKSSATHRMLCRVPAKYNANSSLLIQFRAPLVRMQGPKRYAAAKAALQRSITRSHQGKPLLVFPLLGGGRGDVVIDKERLISIRRSILP